MGAAETALELVATLDVLVAPEQQEDPAFSDATINKLLERLKAAQAGVTCKKGLLGLFCAPTLMDSLSQVFREPISWRSWIPMRAGGIGDPYSPTYHDENVCLSWAALGEAIEGSRQVIRCRQEAASEWSERISRLSRRVRREADPV